MIKFILSAALLFSPVAAQAQAKECLDGKLLSSVLLGIAPDLLNTARERCRPMLPANGFLMARSQAMGQRIQAELGDPAAAISALVKAMTGVDASDELDGKTLVELFGRPIRADIAKMDAKDCTALDQLLAGLEPLPAARLKQVVIGFLTLGKGDGGLNLCPMA